MKIYKENGISSIQVGDNYLEVPKITYKDFKIKQFKHK